VSDLAPAWRSTSSAADRRMYPAVTYRAALVSRGAGALLQGKLSPMLADSAVATGLL
jgi:hypothetical protein